MMKLKGLVLFRVIFLGLYSSYSFQNCLLFRNTIVEAAGIIYSGLIIFSELLFQGSIDDVSEGIFFQERPRGIVRTTSRLNNGGIGNDVGLIGECRGGGEGGGRERGQREKQEEREEQEEGGGAEDGEAGEGSPPHCGG